MANNKFILLIMLTAFASAALPLFLSYASAAQSYAVAGGGSAMVSEWSECRIVARTAGYPIIFIPTKTAAEWSEFRVHYPAGTSLAACGKIIFVTSTKYRGWDLTSDAVADGYCANSASGKQPGTYKAFLYLGTRMPADVLPAGISFIGTGGSLIANDKTDFFTDDGGGNYIRNPIFYNENGAANIAGEYAWTAFKPTGGGNYAVVPNTIPFFWAPCEGYKINTCERHYTGDHACGKYDYYFHHKNWSYVGVNNVITNQWAGKEIAWTTYTCGSCYWNIEYTLDTCLKNSYSIYCVQQ